MNQLCKVCGEPAAGFHFGAFTCEGCKSFFGRTYNNLSQVHECKNGGQCVINKQNRTSCKACRLRKCLMVGMSKSGSRYGRRSNWFKIHCLLQEQASQLSKGLEGGGGLGGPLPGGLGLTGGSFSLSPASMPALSPSKSEDEVKMDSPLLLSSPESCASEGSVEGEVCREGHSREAATAAAAAAAAAGLSLYTGLHPGLSLLHASHIYSRLYPSLPFHPSLLPPPRPNTPPKDPPPSPTPSRVFECPPYPTTLPPPLTMPLPLGFPWPRKRVADSPCALGDATRVWDVAPPAVPVPPEQDTPMDLSVKRPRLLPPMAPTTPVSPPVSPPTTTKAPPSPVDLTTKA